MIANDVVKIEEYLRKYGSPIPTIASVIVEESSKNGVNPYVITAIFCQESSCGKVCHHNNCTGYGITDSGEVGKTRFESTEQAMAHMIQAYANNPRGYKACGTDIRCVGKNGYNPRESWINNVTYFYNNITK